MRAQHLLSFAGDGVVNDDAAQNEWASKDASLDGDMTTLFIALSGRKNGREGD